MTKADIIDKLMIDHDIWECGYTRSQLETLSKKELRQWLDKLKEKGNCAQ